MMFCHLERRLLIRKGKFAITYCESVDCHTLVVKIKHDGITCAMQNPQGTGSVYSNFADQSVGGIMGERCSGV